jgi:hypothetical protein
VEARTRASSSARSTSSIVYLPTLTSALFTVSCRGALQSKEGDVILLLPPLPYEGVEVL